MRWVLTGARGSFRTRHWSYDRCSARQARTGWRERRRCFAAKGGPAGGDAGASVRGFKEAVGQAEQGEIGAWIVGQSANIYKDGVKEGQEAYRVVT